MLLSNLLSNSVFFVLSLIVHRVTCMTVVEGYVGGSATLPCNLTAYGDLEWKGGKILILIKPANGTAKIANGPYQGDVSLVNGDELRINPLLRYRDEDGLTGVQTFTCEDTGGGGVQEIEVRLLVRITGVSIGEASAGRVTVTAGTPKTVLCSVNGNPLPPPSYNWTIGDVAESTETNSFTFTPDTSMKTIKCTAFNSYNNGSVISEGDTTAELNVQYLDTPKPQEPVMVTENFKTTLQCSVEGNPVPRYEWRRSPGSVGVILSTSANYTLENVPRLAAGEYTCTVNNPIDRTSVMVNLVVQYPPDVTVTYDKTTKTLTCTAQGVPDVYSFSQWEHRLDGKLLQTLDTESTVSPATLQLPDTLTYDDTGYYVCQVSNGIKSPQRGQVLVSPQSPPLFQTQSTALTIKEGQLDTISIPFYTYSDTPSVTVVWVKSGDRTLLTSHREESGPVRLIIRGQSVRIEGTVTVLTLSDVTQSDEGNYTVTVTNIITSVVQSKQITVSVSVTVPTTGNGYIKGAIGGGTAAVVLIVIVLIGVFLFRKHRMKSAEANRSTEDQTTVQYQNGRQEGQEYQDLTINPDYVNSAENQQYSTLDVKGKVYQDLALNPDYVNAAENQQYAALDLKNQQTTDYEQCDVNVGVTNIPQYDDVSFSTKEENSEHGNLENKD